MITSLLSWRRARVAAKQTSGRRTCDGLALVVPTARIASGHGCVVATFPEHLQGSPAAAEAATKYARLT